MRHLPHELYSAAQTREIDRIVIEQHHIPGARLMANAGAAALALLKQLWPQAKHIVVVCGGGNNGGDGYELARQALLEDYRVSLFELGKTDKMSDETRAAREALQALGDHIQPFAGSLPGADVLVDGLFGTGLDREVAGLYAQAITALNQQTDTPVLSLDIASGIDANTGNKMGAAVKATATLSFIGLNTGLFTGDGPAYSGEVYFESLQVPASVYQSFTPTARRIDLDDFKALLGPRQRNAHKGHFGHLLVIGGDLGMSGAVRIAAEAGARVGAGLNSVATRSAHSTMLNLARPELMSHGVEDDDALKPLLKKASALVLGPGLGQSRWSQRLFDKALDSDLPIVLDADGLNLLSHNPQQRDNWVLTPHPGEAARLLGCSTAEVQTDRLRAVNALQTRYGGVVVLKGAGTLIADGQPLIHLSDRGNPGMASGGMGDALSGIIGGLLAQHFTPMQAASAGVTLHGMAADKAAEQDGERGMLAMDLMPHLRQLVNLRYE